MDEQQEVEETSPQQPLYRAWLCGAFRLERRVGNRYEPVHPQEWGGHSSPRTALKALLCAPGRYLRRSALMAQIWPDASDVVASRELSVALTYLRKVLRGSSKQGEVLIEESPKGGIKLPGQAILWMDADAASQLLDQAEQLENGSPAVLSVLERALNYLKRGAFLGEDEGEWTIALQGLMERRYYRCRLRLAEIYGQQGRLEKAESLYNDLLRDDPTDEDVICRLMWLLHAQGLTHQSLVIYRRANEFFEKDGMELSPSTRDLAEHLINDRQMTFTSKNQYNRTEYAEGAAPFMPPILLDPLDQEILDRFQRALQRPSTVDKRFLLYLKKRTESYWQDRHSAALPSRELLHYVREHFHRIISLLEGALFSTVRENLCSIASLAAQLIGELYFDMEEEYAQREFKRLAVASAREAKDPVLEAVAWGRLSFVAIYGKAKNARQALTYIQQARQLGQQGNSTVRAWLAAAEAEFQATLADRKACFLALSDAEYSKEPHRPADSYWLYYDQSLSLGYRGVCYGLLAQFGTPRDAVESQISLNDALKNLEPGLVQRRPTLLTDLAGSYVQQGNPEEACRQATLSVQATAQIQSPTNVVRLLRLKKRLDPWKQLLPVKEFNEHLSLLCASQWYKERP